MRYILAALFCLLIGSAQAQTVILQPSGAPSIAIVPTVTTAISTGFIIKTSPGNLYYLSTTVQTQGFLMTFDATTVPADGAVTPKNCLFTSGTSGATLNLQVGPPESYANGIVAALSSTGCFTKTGINALFFKALVQ